MAHKHQPPQFWTCNCERTTGFHIIHGLYSHCVFCGTNRHDLKEIVVPSGMGGVFTVKIISIAPDCAMVKVVGNTNGFDALPPFTVPFKDVTPRWKRQAGEFQ